MVKKDPAKTVAEYLCVQIWFYKLWIWRPYQGGRPE